MYERILEGNRYEVDKKKEIFYARSRFCSRLTMTLNAASRHLDKRYYFSYISDGFTKRIVYLKYKLFKIIKYKKMCTIFVKSALCNIKKSQKKI